ncbi:MAG: hypothetical protein ACI4EF_08595 [Coprococcus sp.]
MFTFFIWLIIITALFGIAFKLAGTLLKASLWLFMLLPIGIILFSLGLVCICTIILIPIGIKLFKAGLHVIIPG